LYRKTRDPLLVQQALRHRSIASTTVYARCDEGRLRGRGHDAGVEAIDHETLALFLASPAARTRPDGKTKKATSANALRTSLRTFFRYAHEAEYTRSNPARLVRRALCGTPPPRAMSDEEQGRLLLALAGGVGPEARRDHALFALMLGSGIRLGSALALETRDVDLERGELALRRTKGDCPVSVPLSRAVCAHLRSYLAGRPDGPLFNGRDGRALSARHAQRRLGIWCRKAGVERRISPHDLRHSFAIRLYKRTRDLLLVQQALRHRSIASTTVYARCDEGRLREALAS
jgi:site-specific recombinase XerC